jgi:hypothetical protein
MLNAFIHTELLRFTPSSLAEGRGTEFCVWEQLRLRYILGASKLGDDLFFSTSYKYIESFENGAHIRLRWVEKIVYLCFKCSILAACLHNYNIIRIQDSEAEFARIFGVKA